MIAGRALKTKTLAHKSVLKCAESLPFLFEYCLSAAAQCRHLLCCTAVKSPSGMWMPDRSKNREQKGGGESENENLQTLSEFEQPEIHQLSTYIGIFGQQRISKWC